ncbi:MAG: DUF3343 domain-containing protein [Eubacteriales bacterium]|nr:DUF3343 domain-containing protein [Eubacteriales bacterium]
MEYIATFYSHFGAIEYHRLCVENSWPSKIMPVPRSLSSSCGSCVRYEGDTLCPADTVPEAVEQIVQVTADGYLPLYRAKNA